MNLEKILTQYDNMFGTYSLEEIEAYLVSTMEKAKGQSEYGILITLLNEIIGFCRDTTQKEKALRYCEELQKILKLMKLEGRIDYATSLLNVANAQVKSSILGDIIICFLSPIYIGLSKECKNKS